MDAAIIEWRTAVRLGPDFLNAHRNLGIALGMKGKLEVAIAELQEAIRLQPDDAKAHYALGWALDAEGDQSAALDALRQACLLDPANSDYRNDYDRILRAISRR